MFFSFRPLPRDEFSMSKDQRINMFSIGIHIDRSENIYTRTPSPRMNIKWYRWRRYEDKWIFDDANTVDGHRLFCQ